MEDTTWQRPQIMELIANAPWREAVTHEEGGALWVAVVPEGSTRADNYAAALERIARLLDELAEA